MKNLFSPVVRNFLAILFLTLSLSSCIKKDQGLKDPGLKDVFSDDFLIGTCMNTPQINGTDLKAKPFIAANFNSVTAENAMKWERIHPEPDRYNFTIADSMINFAIANNMFVVGHTLIWHSQTPDWVFQDSLGNPLERDDLLKRMKDHIFTVVGHFKGKVNGWDVVNEAVNEDGSLRQTNWLRIIGPDYIEKAFEFAREADPDAELYYNDYNIELRQKRSGAVGIINDLRNNGIKVDGVGIQGHWNLDFPSLDEIDEALTEYGLMDLKIMISEMDIDVLPAPENISGADVSDNTDYQKTLNPYVSGLPDSVSKRLADRYADLFSVFEKHKEAVTRVTFWGVNDGYSWKNNWPVKGRTNYPLLFDRNYKPKQAFYSVIKTAKL
jgi:endo-1,4-beta-xylanase